jgi:hypothetical protein
LRFARRESPTRGVVCVREAESVIPLRLPGVADR